MTPDDERAAILRRLSLGWSCAEVDHWLDLEAGTAERVQREAGLAPAGEGRKV